MANLGIMRNGEEIDLDFDDYTESVLPEEQRVGDGTLFIASGWMGFPAYWNHRGQYLDGANSPHEFDLIKIDGWDAKEYLTSRQMTPDEIKEWLKR